MCVVSAGWRHHVGERSSSRERVRVGLLPPQCPQLAARVKGLGHSVESLSKTRKTPIGGARVGVGEKRVRGRLGPK